MIDALARVERNDIARSASGRGYGLLRLRLPQMIDVLPGQFAMLKSGRATEPLLRRAMAYYRSQIIENTRYVEFIYQILGRGTQALAQLGRGEEVAFLGSLGNSYNIEAARNREAYLVAGGVGSAAVFMLAEELMRQKIPVRLFIGGASQGDLCGLNDFIELLGHDRVHCATLDGSYGEAGFVTAPLEKRLGAGSADSVMIYACGPDPMLHAVSRIAETKRIPAELSLESPMACGFGVCVGCAVAVKHDCPEGFVYKKVCTDGPVFRSEDLHW
jgi:dihydroorotate dehydrogenase electron transfer subunit